MAPRFSKSNPGQPFLGLVTGRRDDTLNPSTREFSTRSGQAPRLGSFRLARGRPLDSGVFELARAGPSTREFSTRSGQAARLGVFDSLGEGPEFAQTRGRHDVSNHATEFPRDAGIAAALPALDSKPRRRRRAMRTSPSRRTWSSKGRRHGSPLRSLSSGGRHRKADGDDHLHGGGFTGGSKDGLAERIRPFASRGYLAIAAQYRLAGQAKWPAQIEDVRPRFVGRGPTPSRSASNPTASPSLAIQLADTWRSWPRARRTNQDSKDRAEMQAPARRWPRVRRTTR